MRSRHEIVGEEKIDEREESNKEGMIEEYIFLEGEAAILHWLSTYQ